MTLPIKLAFIWPAWIGKDYILGKLTETDSNWQLIIKKYWKLRPEIENLLLNYKRAVVGDFLKEIAIDKHKCETFVWKKISEDTFDFDFLKKDLLKYKELDLTKYEMYSYWLSDDCPIEEKETIFKNDLWRSPERFLMEIFKNLDWFSTRKSLQKIWDVLQSESGSPFIITEGLVSSLSKNTSYINTGARLLTEIIDLEIDWFVPIKLTNSLVNEKNLYATEYSKELINFFSKGSIDEHFTHKSLEMFHHISEQEIAMRDIWIWVVWNVESNEVDNTDSLKRMKDFEIYNWFLRLQDTIIDMSIKFNENKDVISQVKQFLKNSDTGKKFFENQTKFTNERFKWHTKPDKNYNEKDIESWLLYKDVQKLMVAHKEYAKSRDAILNTLSLVNFTIENENKIPATSKNNYLESSSVFLYNEWKLPKEWVNFIKQIASFTNSKQANINMNQPVSNIKKIKTL